MMRKVLLFLLYVASGFPVLAQIPPSAHAAYIWNGTSWTPATSTASGGNPVGSIPPPAISMYCYNTSTKKWVPADSSCFGGGGGGGAAWGSITGTLSSQTDLQTALNAKVATTTTVNGHALSANVVVSASDLTTGTLPHAQLPALLSGDIPNNAASTSGTSAGLTGSPNVTVNNLTISGTCTGCSAGSGVTLQTNTVNNTSQAILNLLNSSANAVGLTATFTNTSAGNVQLEIAGASYSGNSATSSTAAQWTTARNLAGNSVNGSANVNFANKFIVQGTTDTGLSAAQFLGALATGPLCNTTTTGVLTACSVTGTGSVVQSASSALTGTPTAPTATVGTNTTQLATTAFVLANAGGGFTNPMTTLGDIMYENATPAAARLAAPTTGTVPYSLTSTPSGGVGQAPAWGLSGIPGRTVTTTTDTIAATDRSNIVTYNSASAVAVTLTSAATLGSNFSFGAWNQAAGVVTFTPGAGTVNGASTLAINQGENCTFNSSDNTNYVARCSSGQTTVSAPISVTRSASGDALSVTTNGITATQLAAQYSKGSCTEVWGGSGTSFALTSGDDAISNNNCYNDSGVTRTITAVKCRSDVASNTTTANPTFGAAGTGTTILSGALTCGSSLAYSSTGTVTNASWTTGTGINPVMGGTLTGTSIAVIVEYTF